LTGNNATLIDEFKLEMMEEFEMTDWINDLFSRNGNQAKQG
jgi:hypothetical protein